MLLVGCRPAPEVQVDPMVSRNAHALALFKKIESLGARVFQAGSSVRIMLPSDRLFVPNSANLTRHSVLLLDTVAQLMRLLQTRVAKVSGFADSQPDALRNKALSVRQAEVVSEYLWTQFPDARILYAVGYGDAKSCIAKLPGVFVHDKRHRVEIQFQYLPLLSSLVH